MAMTQKFNFDMEFDAPLPAEVETSIAPAEDEPPPEPVFTLSEVKASEQEAFNKGLAQGAEQARAEAQNNFNTSIETALSKVMEEMSGQLSSMLEAMSEFQRCQGDNALKLAVVVARKVMPQMLYDHAIETVEAVITEVLPAVLDEPRIVVRVNDAVLDQVNSRLDTLGAATGFAGQFIVLADPELGRTDCRVEWADGGVSVSPAKVWKEIDRIVDDHFAAQTAAEDTPTEPAPTPDPELDTAEDTARTAPRIEDGAMSEEVMADG